RRGSPRHGDLCRSMVVRPSTRTSTRTRPADGDLAIAVRRSTGQSRADVRGVRAAEFFEYGQCPVPGVPGGVQIAGVAVDVAGVDERVRLLVQVAQVPEQAKRPLVAVQGLAMVSEAV